MERNGLPPEYDAARLRQLADSDLARLEAGGRKYGDSWRKRGGGEAYHQLTRKWDRISLAVERVPNQDMFEAIAQNPGSDGFDDGKDSLLDDIGDLRRYLYLTEAYYRSQRS